MTVQGGFSGAVARRPPRRSHARSAVGEVADRLGRRRGDLRVLELGAGSGLLTGQLARAGVELLAVERDDDLRRDLVRSLSGSPSGVVVLNAAYDRLPVATGALRGLVLSDPGWFEAPANRLEAARVLAEEGLLCAVLDVPASSDPAAAARSFATPLVGGLEPLGSSVHPHEGAPGALRRTELTMWRRSR